VILSGNPDPVAVDYYQYISTTSTNVHYFKFRIGAIQDRSSSCTSMDATYRLNNAFDVGRFDRLRIGPDTSPNAKDMNSRKQRIRNVQKGPPGKVGR
jgi:hypothetical protein